MSSFFSWFNCCSSSEVRRPPVRADAIRRPDTCKRESANVSILQEAFVEMQDRKSTNYSVKTQEATELALREHFQLRKRNKGALAAKKVAS